MIGGFQKLTLSDYPGNTACIIFTKGCNFNCSYCQNSSLIKINDKDLITEDDIFKYLESRKKLLDGVVISGGEPTIQKNLKELIIKIKNMGFKVKLDTNGSNPNLLEELIKEKLLDYVAMDIKNIFSKYEEVINAKVKIDNIKKSIEILKNSEIDHEFRTTIIKNYHDIPKILKICKYLGKKEKIYLQNFEDSEYVRNKKLKSFTREELIDIQEKVGRSYSNVIVRGL
jgi:pyruvate formate lyase activating enzyme